MPETKIATYGVTMWKSSLVVTTFMLSVSLNKQWSINNLQILDQRSMECTILDLKNNNY